MGKIKTLAKQDYELTFEGKGLSYLYSTTFCRHSLPSGWEFISVAENGYVKEFLSNQTLASMNEAGKYLTPERIRTAIADMDAKILKETESINHLLQMPLTRQVVLEIFQRCGEVALAYSFFDPHYFEALYNASDEEGKTCTALLQDYKNKARDCLNAFYFGEGFVPKLLRQLSKERGIPEQDLAEYDEHELGALMDGQPVETNTLTERRTFCVLIRDIHNMLTIYTGDEACSYAKNFLSTSDDLESSQVIGKCAHQTGSVVRGNVRVIVRDYSNKTKMIEEMQAMQPGEILVTQTTDPEMLPALQKASAAITDIGGMLSHTAITSRELNIPCIVGTKNATSVLKNGDLVEIDAEHGVVRKIS